MVNRFEQFTGLISAGNRFVQKIERDEMEKYGLKGAYAQYLLAMARYPQGITASELCEVCDRDKAAVSRMLSELESKKLIHRVNPDEGQYRSRLALTDAGLEAADFVRRRATIAVELAGQGLSEKSRQIFYACLARIAANLENLCKNGLPDEL